MRITQSSVAMTSARSYEAETRQTVIHKDQGQGTNAGMNRVIVSETTTKRLEVEGGMVHYVQGGLDGQAGEAPRISNKVTSATASPAAQPAVTIPARNDDWFSDIQARVEDDPKIMALRKMLEVLERMNGKSPRRTGTAGKVSGFKAASASYKLTSAAYMGSMELRVQQTPGRGAGPEGVNGWWVRQTTESAFVKGEEHTAYSSVGTAVTADGRTIDFGISLEMSREFEAAYVVTGKPEVFTDPLVINLDTDAASLSDVSFYFDLDADGKEEEISTLGKGSGFLALDKNGDGKINDGSELFGAKTGDGFGELSQYDGDGNGWIDEGDEVFEKLKVWTKCGSGEAKLLSLKEAGVGAIFLGSQGTQFTLTGAAGDTRGMVRRTGMYLHEDGRAGTVQHVDMKA